MKRSFFLIVLVVSVSGRRLLLQSVSPHSSSFLTRSGKTTEGMVSDFNSVATTFRQRLTDHAHLANAELSHKVCRLFVKEGEARATALTTATNADDTLQQFLAPVTLDAPGAHPKIAASLKHTNELLVTSATECKAKTVTATLAATEPLKRAHELVASSKAKCGLSDGHWTDEAKVTDAIASRLTALSTETSACNAEEASLIDEINARLYTLQSEQAGSNADYNFKCPLIVHQKKTPSSAEEAADSNSSSGPTLAAEAAAAAVAASKDADQEKVPRNLREATNHAVTLFENSGDVLKLQDEKKVTERLKAKLENLQNDIKTRADGILQKAIQEVQTHLDQSKTALEHGSPDHADITKMKVKLEATQEKLKKAINDGQSATESATIVPLVSGLFKETLHVEGSKFKILTDFPDSE